MNRYNLSKLQELADRQKRQKEAKMADLKAFGLSSVKAEGGVGIYGGGSGSGGYTISYGPSVGGGGGHAGMPGISGISGIPGVWTVTAVHYYFPNNIGQSTMLGKLLGNPFTVEQTNLGTSGVVFTLSVLAEDGLLRSVTASYAKNYLDSLGMPDTICQYVLKNLFIVFMAQWSGVLTICG